MGADAGADQAADGPRAPAGHAGSDAEGAMRVLVTGGAGYVGSVSVERLLQAGHAVTVLDDLSTGHRAAPVDGARLVVGSYADRALVERLLAETPIDAVLHCAARSLVAESIADPARYYRDNVAGGVALLEAVRVAGVRRLVFSSTAAVYGVPAGTPIAEDAPLAPINPYGETKRTFEGALRWYGLAYGLRSVSLRYFNVAGASERNGERHDPETHLIPNILIAVESGRPLTVFGTDYPTPDGTNIRDYIHVARPRRRPSGGARGHRARRSPDRGPGGPRRGGPRDAPSRSTSAARTASRSAR